MQMIIINGLKIISLHKQKPSITITIIIEKPDTYTREIDSKKKSYQQSCYRTNICACVRSAILYYLFFILLLQEASAQFEQKFNKKEERLLENKKTN